LFFGLLFRYTGFCLPCLGVFPGWGAEPVPSESLTMATRLYPQTSDVTILEKIAGVPAGTAKVLEQIEATIPEGCPNMGCPRYDAINAEPNVEAYHSLQLFGFGRLKAVQLVRSLGMVEYSDGTTDPDLIRKICEIQGVPREAVELMIAHGGVYWN